MIRIVATFGLVLFATLARAESLTLSAHYDATGTNPDGSKYTGDVAVRILSDTTFAIEWTIAGTVYKGFGMRRNDALAATYLIDGEPGLVIYQVAPKGGLDGLWAVRGENGNGTEKLTPRD
jgi:hypothetical protein